MSKSWNWRLWAGFVLALLAPFAYFSLFEKLSFAFWISVAAFVIAIVLLAEGLRRAYAQPDAYRGKIAGPILAILALGMIGVFSFGIYMMGQAYSKAANAPRVGDKAPEFALTDATGRKVSIAQLLATPLAGGASSAPRGVLLVFYRGYW
jgi:hypothetical protein